jgi:hypothetical protein
LWPPTTLAVALAGAVLAIAACGGGSGDRAEAPRATTAAVPAPAEDAATAPKDDGLSAMSDEATTDDPLAQVAPTAKYVFDSWFEKEGPDDPRYYENGVWHGPADCPTCGVGPSGLGAVLWAKGMLDEPAKRTAIVRTFEERVRGQRSNGSYGTAGNSEAITVAFFAPALGSTLLVLGERLPASTRARWARSLRRSAEFLRDHKELDWYVNGNINLAYAATLYVTYLATGDSEFRTLFRRQLRFATDPPKGRWSDRGLETPRRPTRSDGSDGRGYLTETGPGGTGYDPEYTYVQLDVLSRLYLLSGDREVLRLLNLLANQTLRNVDAKWNLLTTGTRHPEPNRYVPYTTSALLVLDRLGGNRRLQDSVAPQVARTLDLYRSATTFSHPNIYRSVDSQLGTLMLAMEARRPGDARVFRRLRR